MEEVLLARARRASLAPGEGNRAAKIAVIMGRLRWAKRTGLSRVFLGSLRGARGAKSDHCSWQDLTKIEFSHASPRRVSTTRKAFL